MKNILPLLLRWQAQPKPPQVLRGKTKGKTKRNQSISVGYVGTGDRFAFQSLATQVMPRSEYMDSTKVLILQSVPDGTSVKFRSRRASTWQDMKPHVEIKMLKT